MCLPGHTLTTNPHTNTEGGNKLWVAFSSRFFLFHIGVPAFIMAMKAAIPLPHPRPSLLADYQLHHPHHCAHLALEWSTVPSCRYHDSMPTTNIYLQPPHLTVHNVILDLIMPNFTAMCRCAQSSR